MTLSQHIEEEVAQLNALIDSLPKRVEETPRVVLTDFLRASLTRIAKKTLEETRVDHKYDRVVEELFLNSKSN